MQPLETSDGSRTLHSDRYAQTYRSLHGALTESRHVFLEGSGVAERLRAGRSTAVLEVGFGTGLNFLVTARAWELLEGHAGPDRSAAPERSAPAMDVGARPVGANSPVGLSYTALENELPPLARLAALGYEELLAPSVVPRRLLSWLASLGEPPAPGAHRLALFPDRADSAGLGRASAPSPGAELELVIGDALSFDPGRRRFDAVYLDPFSPKANPAMWTGEFLTRLARALSPGGRLVSYSVSGEVRRALGAAGLGVRKAPGPEGGKREMLVATAPLPTPAT